MGKLPQSGTAIGRAASFETFKFKLKFCGFWVIVLVFYICLHVGQHSEPLNMIRIVGCDCLQWYHNWSNLCRFIKVYFREFWISINIAPKVPPKIILVVHLAGQRVISKKSLKTSADGEGQPSQFFLKKKELPFLKSSSSFLSSCLNRSCSNFHFDAFSIRDLPSIHWNSPLWGGWCRSLPWRWGTAPGGSCRCFNALWMELLLTGTKPLISHTESFSSAEEFVGFFPSKFFPQT